MNSTMKTNVFIGVWCVRVWTVNVYITLTTPSILQTMSKMNYCCWLNCLVVCRLFLIFVFVLLMLHTQNGHIDTDWLFPCSNRLKCHHYKFGCRKCRITFKPLPKQNNCNLHITQQCLFVVFPMHTLATHNAKIKKLLFLLEIWIAKLGERDSNLVMKFGSRQANK